MGKLENRKLLECVAELSDCNPFTIRRIQLEKKALGPDYIEDDADWNVYVGSTENFKNLDLILEKAEQAIKELRPEILDRRGEALGPELHELYADVALFILYHRHRKALSTFVETQLTKKMRMRELAFYKDFARDAEQLLSVHPEFSHPQYSSAHLFALAFQIVRAFYHIYEYLIGISLPMQELRARVWESIFTHDIRRYRRSLFSRMGDVPTIITGPSGTGKELVARAVGLSRYIPFDPQSRTFKEDFALSFYALNLSAFQTTLIESELFGHKKGAFTGAVSDRKGWLEICGALGTVFLDEVAEIEETIQVKLLRVLESREFQPIGDTSTLNFQGKIISASNRDIDKEIRAGKFRADLYYRLCADQIHTPALSERLADNPRELVVLTEFLLKRWCDPSEVKQASEEFCGWIRKHIGMNYLWPGNVRELDQCIRNLVIHGSYQPQGVSRITQPPIPADMWAQLQDVQLSASDLVDWYCKYAYQKLNNFEEAGKRLGIDRRTVRARVL